MFEPKEGSPVLEVDDLVILLMGAPSKSNRLESRIEGVTRLEKLVFLLWREHQLGKSLTEDPDFYPHNFGPFSPKVYQAVADLAAYGLIRESGRIAASTEDSWETEHLIASPSSDPYATRNFELTDKGRRYYEALLSELPKGTENEIKGFKDQFGSLPLRTLVRYVYERHDDMTGKSQIRDQVLGDG